MTGAERDAAQTKMYDDIGRIEQGLATFVDVGEALLYIRDGKKYRAAKYATFEEYCRDRWEMTPQHGQRLIQAAELLEGMEPVGSILPRSEGWGFKRAQSGR
jgi:hypothetical protein